MSPQSLDGPPQHARALERRPWDRAGDLNPEKSISDWAGGLIGMIPKQTRRALRKTIKRVIRRHGPELIAAAATGVITSLLSAMAVREEGKKKKKKKKKH
jgi:hypothetical protein